MWADREERTCWESRRHGVVLARPLVRCVALALAGFVCFALGWPVMVAGPPLIAFAALGAALTVWRWERTRVVVTTRKLFVVHGTLRRRAAAVRLDRVGAIEVEQSLLGRMLGYGTVVAGELEIAYVPQPRHVGTLVTRLGA
jgi:uncharacterized membrane protein YdbT with pleckstrin-like domain